MKFYDAIKFFATRDWLLLLKDDGLLHEFYQNSGVLSAQLCDCVPMPPHYDKHGSITCAPHSSGGFGGSDESHRLCVCTRHATHFVKSVVGGN